MANFPRSSKPASDWTIQDLLSYRITTVDEDEKTFFKKTTLRPPTCSLLRGFMSTPQSQDVETAKMCHYFHLADKLTGGHESAIDNFSVKMLEKLGYDTKKNPKINVSILADDGRILLVQENKIRGSTRNPLPQVVAEAIAAFGENNRILVELGEHYRQSITIPAITMQGTYPTFYKIKVTSKLAKAVRKGYYPVIQTTVHRHIPSLPIPSDPGMGQSLNRDHIMACLNAFKVFVED
ncbi:hypothetical protein EV702DRAFT_1194346 [Suillus placidus]|uniref:Uncharacterized protein n=1 Tax=Suillus placidus TaxID=48579 RepID=A0A9P7A0H2_9AGAM|nr:hypothetical protein EV702DRAFT_1194346 [Suillus placidus]